MSDLKMSKCAKCKCMPELIDGRTSFFVRCKCEVGENVTYGQSVSFLDHINIGGDDELTDKLGNAAFESVPWDKLKQSAIDAWETKQVITKQQEQIELLRDALVKLSNGEMTKSTEFLLISTVLAATAKG